MEEKTIDQRVDEIVELILIWEKLNKTVWPVAKAAIEHKINKLGEGLFEWIK